MPRHLFAILDDLTANLAELKATLAPLALIGGTVVAETRKPAPAQPRATGAASGRRGPVSAKRRTAMRDQGRYMSAIRPRLRTPSISRSTGRAGTELRRTARSIPSSWPRAPW
jgi:hypothetical protein